MKTNKRIKWIDYYKGIAIILVLVHHVSQYFPAYRYIPDYLTDFHVSMFFFISGYICAEKKQTDAFIPLLKKKAQRLLIPYLFWALLSACVKIGVLLATRSMNMNGILQELADILTVGNGPVWFLKAMFFSSVIFQTILFLIKMNRKYLAILALCLIIIVTLLQNFQFILIVLCRRSMLCIIELSIGFLLSDAIKSLIKGGLIIGILIFLVGSLLSIFGNITISYKNGLSPNILLSLLSCNAIDVGIATVLIHICCSHDEKKIINWVHYLGVNSLAVLVIHPLLLNCFSYPFAHRVKTLSTASQFLIMGAVLIALLLSLFPLIRFVNVHFPQLIGRRKLLNE